MTGITPAAGTTGAADTAGTACGAAAGSSRRGWTLALASLGAFMASLDVVIVATALPTLQTHLGASLADLEWTINAYNLVFACLMLTGAALGDRFGRRRMYVAGLLVFVLGSALAALSTSAGLLIAARSPRPKRRSPRPRQRVSYRLAEGAAGPSGSAHRR
jgi:MFS family permease